MPIKLDIVKPLFETSTLPGLGPERRDEALPLSVIEDDIDEVLAASNLAGDAADKVRSAALLWHDHLDASHSISQEIRDSDGSFLHGIMHRREPDYPNANYWFHRAATHPSFVEIFKRAITAGTEMEFLKQSTAWDPFAMVDAVSEARIGSADYKQLQKLQALEVKALLEWFCR
ncbi:MAG: hypothetical protein CMO74_12455 [Verrucomicrobiales bacterium]|nr:hypothetical protein [Verrucomicrobiales bacterium]|tara:strand:- start:1200 stop:1721 length:522 start_codon:yes stop_codon:yes gene_type:complete